MEASAKPVARRASRLGQQLSGTFVLNLRSFLRIPTVLVLVVCLLAGSTSAQAASSSLILSDFVSDGPTPPDVTLLDATLTFTLDAATIDLDAVASTVLTVSVANQTTAPNEFNITEIFFNVPDTVTSASFSVNPGSEWMLNFDNLPGGGIMADGFGDFDLHILDAPGDPIAKVNSGDTVDFGLTLSGTGIISVDDFVTEFSENQTLEVGPMLAAVKFVNGPGDVSAFGATPEPSTVALLTAGGSLIFLRRKRSR